MGELADELEKAVDGNLWKHLCGVQRAMNDNPDDAETIFTFCTLRLDKPARGLSKTFQQHGIDLPDQTITRHRQRQCACAKRMPERY